MFRPKTFLDLCMAMKTTAEVVVKNDYQHAIGIITGIRANDDNGHDWIVTIQPAAHQDTDYASAIGSMVMPDEVELFFHEE